MAVTNSTNTIAFIGDGLTTAFQTNFLVYAATHVTVYLDGVLQTTGFTVSTVPTEGAQPIVTFAVAPAANVDVTIQREVPVTQLSVYATAGAFPAKTTEKNFDLAVMGIQQVAEQLGRAVKIPVNAAITAGELPDPTDPANAGRGLKIKADSTGLDTFELSTTPFNSPLTTKGDIAVYSVTADRQAVGTNGTFLTADSVQPSGLAWTAVHLPTINPIINGGMDIWQRGTTFTAPPASTYTADRWNIPFVSSALVTVNRSLLVPTVSQAGALFRHSLEVDVTTADATVSAGDYFLVRQAIEGYNWQPFAQRDITLSFWVFSSKAGDHCVALRNSGNDRSCVMEYTVNVADTWEYKTVTFPSSPDAGTWNFENGVGVQVSFALMTGTTFHTTAGAWQTGNFLSTSAQVNVLDTVANVFRVTAVKLETGPSATPFVYEPFESTLARCERYYQKTFNLNTAPAQNLGILSGMQGGLQGVGASSPTVTSMFQFKRRMRASATIVTFNPNALNSSIRNTSMGANTSGNTVSIISEQGFVISYTTAAGSSAGHFNGVHYTADAEL